MKTKNIEFNSDRITLKDDSNFQWGIILIVACFIVLGVSSYISKGNILLDIFFYAYSGLAILFLTVFLMRRDFSKEIPLKDIKYIKLNYKINDNINLKIYTKNGKCRFFNSLNNKQEAQDFIQFAEREELKIAVKEKILS